MTDLRITTSTDETGLYHRYPGQNTPQPAYIELDLREATLAADYNAEIGNAVPFSAFHGFDRRYPIPILTGTAAARLMQSIAPLARRILADWEEVWDGNNHVARLGDDADAAEGELTGQLSRFRSDVDPADLVQVWDADAATNGDEADEYGITADTTDKRLDEIEADIAQQLADTGPNRAVVLDGVGDYLRQIRDEMADTDR